MLNKFNACEKFFLVETTSMILQPWNLGTQKYRAKAMAQDLIPREVDPVADQRDGLVVDLDPQGTFLGLRWGTDV